MFSLTVVATTGERFSAFAPFVASVNDAGIVAFQAALRDGGSGVFVGDGGEVEELVERSLHACVTSHPDLNDARETLDSAVEDFAANPVSVNASGQVAIRVSLADGRHVILRADPPR